MNFCLCGNSTCICKTSCICIHRGCLCSECHDLRKEDCGKEIGLPSSFREFAQRASGVDTCKCESSPRLPQPVTEICSPGPSSEVANESIKESESSIPKIGSKAQDLQHVSSNQILIPVEQEMVPAQDIETNKSKQPELCSSEHFSREEYFCKAPNEQEKQIFKAITFIKEQDVFSIDDSVSSSDEIPVAEEAFVYLSRTEYPQSQNNQSDSEKSCSDIPSTSERVELPSSRSSSGISVLELPENEWGSCSQAEPHFTGNHLVAISSVVISSNLMDNLSLRRPESTTPTMMFGEGYRYDASLGRSISPIQIITTNPTVLVSPSGELHLLPLQNSPSLRPQTPASNSTHVSPSTNSGKTSSDSADKVSIDIPPINIQNSEKLQTEYKEKLSPTVESLTPNTPEQESNNPRLGKRGNLQEENSITISDKEFKSNE